MTKARLTPNFLYGMAVAPALGAALSFVSGNWLAGFWALCAVAFAVLTAKWMSLSRRWQGLAEEWQRQVEERMPEIERRLAEAEGGTDEPPAAKEVFH